MQKLTFKENLENRMNHYGISEDYAIIGFRYDYERGLIGTDQYDEKTLEVKEDGAESYLMDEEEFYKFWRR